jgi:hypothetical protein
LLRLLLGQGVVNQLEQFRDTQIGAQEQSAIESTIRGDPNLECSAGPFAPGRLPLARRRSAA